MIYLLLADFAVVVHAMFVFFVVTGGIAALRWPRLAWLHLPAAVWGVAIEIMGWICPLTHLENHFRRLGGETGYTGSFIARYLEPVLYPPGLTVPTQTVMGLGVLILNAVLYARFWRQYIAKRD